MLDRRARRRTPATCPGAPRLWTAGSRPFGPGCVLVRSSRRRPSVEHVGRRRSRTTSRTRTCYGISFNSANFLKVLQGIEGAATARTVATDALTPSAARLLREGVPVGRARRRRAAAAPGPRGEDARRGRRDPRIGAHRRAMRSPRPKPRWPPGVTERQLTGVFMEAMAVGRRHDSDAHRTSRGSRRASTRGTARAATRRSDRGDLVAFDAGVIRGGYVGELGRTARRSTASRGRRPSSLDRWDELWDRLLAACRPGAPVTDLLDAYDAAGVPPPPDAGRPGTRPRVRSPPGDRRAPAHRGRAAVRGRHGAGAHGLRLARRRRRASTARSPSSSPTTGPELLSTNPFRDARSPIDVTDSRCPAARGDHPLREGSGDQDRDDHDRTVPTSSTSRRSAPAGGTPTCIFKASIDDDVKVLVVRGVGDHLGTGADLDELMAKQAARHVAARGVRASTDEDDVTLPSAALVPGRRLARSTGTATRGRAAAASRTSRRSASSRSRATATAGTSTRPPTPTW